MMTTDQLRQAFLDFFAEQKHVLVPSSSLIPENDPTILFTTAGMAQFKDLFLGIGKKPYSRAVSVQKCLRTGDLDNVGRTPRHHTFFEMLGFFSFGDYFKKEAIRMLWTFYTERLKISPDRLFVSVFRDDDEAFRLWRDEIGVPENRIKRMDEKDNFWPGHPRDIPNGPCGPCTEVYFSTDASAIDEDNPDFEKLTEVGNIVFTQFNRVDGGKLEPLPSPNVDFGMGLERLACLMQGKTSNFDTDTFVWMLAGLEKVLGLKYERDSADGVRMRRIVDHVRAAVFAIADRALPSNEGRGYVVRKIIRRAILDAKELGMISPALHKLVPVVCDVMRYYAETTAQAGNIAMFIENEEKQFLKTIEQGMEVLQNYVAEVRLAGKHVLDGDKAFKLYDTYGLPLEETERILDLENIQVDKSGFENAMKRQRELAQAGSKMQGEVFTENYLSEIKSGFPPTLHTVYEDDTRHLAEAAMLQAIVVGEKVAARAAKGDDVILIAEASPFYAESGGQVGDRGIVIQPGDDEEMPLGVPPQDQITGGTSARVEIRDTQVNAGYILHFGKVTHGTLQAGRKAFFYVDEKLRDATRKNHTAAHLLHRHLKDVLGSHVTQAGSLVDEHRCRFDFTHPKQVTAEELREIERRVNADIQKHIDLAYRETSLANAKAEGVIALFGEKYGDRVRVVEVPGVSKELCGGTHIGNIGRIGAFKFTQETAVAAGVRRVEAVTGDAAMDALFRADRLVGTLQRTLSAREEEILPRLEKLMQELKDAQKELNRHEQQKLLAGMADIIAKSPVIGGVRVVSHVFPDGAMDGIRGALEALKPVKEPHAVCLIGGGEGKASIVVKLSDTLVKEKKLNANPLIQQVAAVVGGKGGGRPEMAQAGGNDAANIPQALAAWQAAIAKALQ